MENNSRVFGRVDSKILTLMQEDARLTTAELAQKISLSNTPCWRRLKRLEEVGIIEGYHARLNARQLGWGVTAFVHVMLESHQPELGLQFEAAILDLPEVVACHNISGQYDFLLQIVAKDLEGFGEFARNELRRLPGVKELNSSFSLKAVKTEGSLPIPSR